MMHRISLANAKTLELVEGDITQQDTDAIVNAANSSLLGGGGVDGAIHLAGGPAILADCKTILARQGPLPTGKAVATTGGRLKAKKVIHTVGPIYSDGDSGEPRLLADCYRNSIALADMLKLASIAFPSISTGAYGYPVDEAAPIALRITIESLLKSQYVQLVRFVLFGANTYHAYVESAHNINAAGVASFREAEDAPGN